jgi:hypothetical protein
MMACSFHVLAGCLITSHPVTIPVEDLNIELSLLVRVHPACPQCASAKLRPPPPWGEPFVPCATLHVAVTNCSNIFLDTWMSGCQAVWLLCLQARQDKEGRSLDYQGIESTYTQWYQYMIAPSGMFLKVFAVYYNKMMSFLSQGQATPAILVLVIRASWICSEG